MNTFSWILLLSVTVITVASYVGLCLFCVRQHKQIETLKTQLDVFVDSSIRVAQSVDQLLQHPQDSDRMNVASRRWVLQEAKSRVQNGESVVDIAAPLGLSRDEMRLLHTQAR